jgi:hypothetical protein
LSTPSPAAYGDEAEQPESARLVAATTASAPSNFFLEIAVMYNSLIGETTATIRQSLSDGFSLASAHLIVGLVLSQTATIYEQMFPLER